MYDIVPHIGHRLAEMMRSNDERPAQRGMAQKYYPHALQSGETETDVLSIRSILKDSDGNVNFMAVL